MGLPGSGKTYLAERLKSQLESYQKTVRWFNADQVRKEYNDWDFSEQGRIRQSLRMRDLANASDYDYCIADFVAPLVDMRHNFDADWTVWMDTISEGRFADTNKIFVEPASYDFRILEKDANKWAKYIANNIVDP